MVQALYKKRTEMAKKDYLRQLAAYRANLVSKGGGGEDMYAAFPGGYNFPGMANGGLDGQLGQHVPPNPPGPHIGPPEYCGGDNQEFVHQVT